MFFYLAALFDLMSMTASRNNQGLRRVTSRQSGKRGLGDKLEQNLTPVREQDGFSI